MKTGIVLKCRIVLEAPPQASTSPFSGDMGRNRTSEALLSRRVQGTRGSRFIPTASPSSSNPDPIPMSITSIDYCGLIAIVAVNLALTPPQLIVLNPDEGRPSD